MLSKVSQPMALADVLLTTECPLQLCTCTKLIEPTLSWVLPACHPHDRLPQPSQFNCHLLAQLQACLAGSRWAIQGRFSTSLGPNCYANKVQCSCHGQVCLADNVKLWNRCGNVKVQSCICPNFEHLPKNDQNMTNYSKNQLDENQSNLLNDSIYNFGSYWLQYNNYNINKITQTSWMLHNLYTLGHFFGISCISCIPLGFPASPKPASRWPASKASPSAMVSWHDGFWSEKMAEIPSKNPYIHIEKSTWWKKHVFFFWGIYIYSFYILIYSSIYFCACSAIFLHAYLYYLPDAHSYSMGVKWVSPQSEMVYKQ